MKTQSYCEKDALRAAQIIFPEALIAKKLGRGFSHDIYLVETNSYPEKVIVRFSNNNPPEYSLAKEIRVSNILNSLGIPVARIILHDASKSIVPHEFVVMSIAEGEDLDSVWNRLSGREKEQISRKIGGIMGKIHSVKFDAFGDLLPEGIESKGNFSLKQVGSREKANPAAFELFARIFSDLGMLSAFDVMNTDFTAQIGKYFLENKKLAETTEDPALIHGDLYPQNFKVKKIKNEWFVTCLFDFEYSAAHIREYDFIKLHRAGLLEKGKVRESILEGYSKFQKVSGDFDKKVEYFRITRDLGFTVVLLKSGDKELAKKVLERIKEKIGFRGEIFRTNF